ncbi:MAG: ATP-binding cassette domain-containing protein [Alphaproteobacteria bacterium]|jgi:phospholipid/cholesterol/gamma-HCH transport system ATP-binding protein|nr:ATP-binding cassette domain-containing protein [Alphaproteobacteria bacterium]MBP9777225.1 ATP-binding cassette domain-containing protein [Alphaproteobacteria bacterium]
MTPKFVIKNLHKSFGHKHVLQGVNFEVAAGESLVIIGGSGTGKSVLLKCLLGLIQPDSGSIQMDGKEITKETHAENEARLQDIGVVFQGSALFDSLKVWENVAFRLIHAQHMNRKQAKQIALQKLAAVGLNESVAELSPAEISGGMQRRVALARAIATQPHVLFFDEPTSGLDPIFSSVIDGLIHRCVKDLGATAITITHDMNSARHVGDRIALLCGGTIVWCGPADTIDDSTNPYVQQFIHGLPSGPIQLETETRHVA